MSKELNCFGFDTLLYRKTFNEKEPYKFEKDSNVIYVCFENTTDSQPIIRITKDSNTYVQEWAYGTWENRKSIASTDWKAINETITVD